MTFTPQTEPLWVGLRYSFDAVAGRVVGWVDPHHERTKIMTDLAQPYVEARRDYLRHIARKRADHETTIFLMQECREARDRYLDTRRPWKPDLLREAAQEAIADASLDRILAERHEASLRLRPCWPTRTSTRGPLRVTALEPEYAGDEPSRPVDQDQLPRTHLRATPGKEHDHDRTSTLRLVHRQ